MCVCRHVLFPVVSVSGQQTKPGAASQQSQIEVEQESTKHSSARKRKARVLDVLSGSGCITHIPPKAVIVTLCVTFGSNDKKEEDRFDHFFTCLAK